MAFRSAAVRPGPDAAGSVCRDDGSPAGSAAGRAGSLRVQPAATATARSPATAAVRGMAATGGWTVCAGDLGSAYVRLFRPPPLPVADGRVGDDDDAGQDVLHLDRHVERAHAV